VVPYTRAKERFFPSPEPGTPEDVKLLQEIRDLLAQQSGGGAATVTPPTP
jgi:large conductance mechanosensitive channel